MLATTDGVKLTEHEATPCDCCTSEQLPELLNWPAPLAVKETVPVGVSVVPVEVSDTVAVHVVD